jgi:hypothetical protein
VIQWGFIVIQWDINGIYPLVMTNSSPRFFDGPNRNGDLKKMAMKNNQMVD